MKRRLSYLMMVVLSAGVLASCNEEVIQDNSYGYLGLRMENDTSTDVIFKSGSSDELVFAVDVRNGSGQTVASVDDHRTVTTDNPIKLQIGNYDVVASNGEDINAAFNNPYYKGTKNVRIYPDKINTVNLTCSLANTIFSVEFPSEFAENFDLYEVSVSNGTGSPLVLSNAPEPGNPLEAGFSDKAYFAVTGTLTWNLTLRNKEGGIYTTGLAINDVQARQHYHLKFRLAEDVTADGAFVIKVILDSRLDETSHEMVLDFDNRNLPSLESNPEFAAVSGVAASVKVNEDPVVTKMLTVSTPVGLKHLRITHDNEVLSANGLPETVELTGTSSDLSSIGIIVNQVISRSIAAGATSVTMDFTQFISGLPVGLYQMAITAIDSKNHYQVFDFIFRIIADVEAEADRAYTGWACFAKLEGHYYPDAVPAGLSFQYRKSSDSGWNELPSSAISVNTSARTYTAIVFGLQPSATYVFRSVTEKDKETKELTFTTSAAEDIHNLSFDNWYQDGKAWMPNLNSSNYVWDSANLGTANLPVGAVVPTTPETSDVVRGKAARLETMTALGKLAAGNVYIGKFAKVSGLGAELDWGYPFSSRPVALRGYYKYSPKTIDIAESPYSDQKGKGDQCQIQILLTDWAGMFHINTSKKEFVDMANDPNIIAHGSLVSGNNDSGYVKFTIPLVYRNNRIPKYIVIVGAASRYGDYFTGGKGSVLRLDEFELVYDPGQLTSEEYSQVFSRVDPF